ncbi:MAG TPA: ABC transporter permease [bacterium]|nr:ABC transporter permease [bacterium]
MAEALAAPGMPGGAAATPRSGMTQVARRFRRNRKAVLGAGLLGVVAAAALLAPLVSPYSPTQPSPEEVFAAPASRHWMGTDEIGRDLFSRVLAGARISLAVGLAASALTLAGGVVFGLISGYRGGWADTVIMRGVDVMLAVPTLLFALAIAAALGSALSNVVLAVGVASIPRFTRFVRGCVLSARENVYVEAARAGGCSEARVAVRHILPNIYGPALILGTLNVGVAILTAATLSFLGMGAQPPTPEWGLILAQGRDYLQNAWWISTFPGVAIALTVLAVNLVGDGLHDALDPRLRL